MMRIQLAPVCNRCNRAHIVTAVHHSHRLAIIQPAHGARRFTYPPAINQRLPDNSGQHPVTTRSPPDTVAIDQQIGRSRCDQVIVTLEQHIGILLALQRTQRLGIISCKLCRLRLERKRPVLQPQARSCTLRATGQHLDGNRDRIVTAHQSPGRLATADCEAYQRIIRTCRCLTADSLSQHLKISIGEHNGELGQAIGQALHVS